jgi:hypothetical protein
MKFSVNNVKLRNAFCGTHWRPHNGSPSDEAEYPFCENDISIKPLLVSM